MIDGYEVSMLWFVVSAHASCPF